MARVGSESEFISVGLEYKNHEFPVVLHVADMAQLHQYLDLINHISLENEALFLEHILLRQKHFVNQVDIKHGAYKLEMEYRNSCALK